MEQSQSHAQQVVAAQAPTRFEKSLATTVKRAESLFQDGYTATPDTDRIGVYYVQTPERTRLGMTYRQVYEVDLANRTCDCEFFQHAIQKMGEETTCKHLKATEKAVTAAALLVAPLFAGKSAAHLQRGQGVDLPIPSATASPCLPSPSADLRAQNAQREWDRAKHIREDFLP